MPKHLVIKGSTGDKLTFDPPDRDGDVIAQLIKHDDSPFGTVVSTICIQAFEVDALVAFLKGESPSNEPPKDVVVRGDETF